MTLDCGVIYALIDCQLYIQSLNSSVNSIIIPGWACSDKEFTIFDFSRYTLVESIEIGDESFGSVQTFEIDGLNRLKTIKIGNNSFTQEKNDYGNDKSKSFHILNCESLESIQIGEYSFSDYAGDFELRNLSQLQSIQIGTIESYSYNFRYSSFVIRGIYVILTVYYLDLPKLKRLILGATSFQKTAELDLSSYKSLESIEIGNNNFQLVKMFYINGMNLLKNLIIGDNSFNQLTTSFLSNPHSASEWMENSNKSKSFHILNCESLQSIQIGRYSFGDFGGDFELKNLPQLQSLQIGSMEDHSTNFYGSSFVIRGIDMI